MRRMIACCFSSICFLVLCLVSTAHAADTPEKVIREMLDKIKAAANASPIVDYVDWDEAFAKASAEQKEVMNVKGPAEMKSFYTEVLKNPSAMMKKQFEERINSVPEEQRAMMETSMKQMEKVMEEKEKEMQDRIRNTTYEIGETSVEGDNATVKLTQTYKGESKDDEVKLVKRGNNWLLPTVSVLASEGKGAAVQ